MQPAADAPPFPDPLAYLWDWLVDILGGCGGNGLGPPSIAWVDLAAWSAVTGTVPARWETDALMRLGQLYAASLSKKGKNG